PGPGPAPAPGAAPVPAAAAPAPPPAAPPVQMSRASRVYLHVGVPKTGTTFLQGVLAGNRARLRENGVLYPGRDEAHHRAAWDLRDVPARRADDQHVRGAWDRLVQAALEWHGHVVVSSELFGYARPRHVARARRALAGTELHLVLTVRDLARQVPAVWQERVKNQHTVEYGTFVDDLLQPDSGIAICRAFWYVQDAVAVLRRWADGLPPARVHVVTVPPAGAPPEELWRRFCTAVEVTAEGHHLDVPAANVSLSLPQTELLRRISAGFDDLPWPRYRREVRDRLLPVLARAVPDTPRAGLAEPARTALARRSQAMAAQLARQRYDVVGSLDDLLVDAAAAPGVQQLPETDVLDAAVAVIRDLLEHRRGRSSARARPASGGGKLR
ncbi:MAG: hypothetical protein M3P83_07250, partial [Actinomycetota bacterium]|nr:hypothetical protein [Actinomycetota bacterium]